MSGWMGAVQAGSELMGNIMNYVQTDKTNSDNRNFSYHMWDVNNQYNTPAMQRARAVEAGYNPNLFYGQGTLGNSSSPASSPPATAPKVDPHAMSNAITSIYDIAIKKAQVANIEADTANKVASTEGITAESGTKNLNYGVRFQNYDNTVATEQERTKTIRLDNELKSITKENLDTRQKTVIDEMRQRISLMQKSGERMSVQNMLDAMEINLNKYGVTKSDPFFARIMALISGVFVDSKLNPNPNK